MASCDGSFCLKELEYPENFLVVVFDPANKDFWLLPDAIEILLESLGYELYFIKKERQPESPSENRVEAELLFRNRLDSSFLGIKSEFYIIPLGTNMSVVLGRIKECYLISNATREREVTEEVKRLIECDPYKVDLFSIIESDSVEEDSFLYTRANFLSSAYGLCEKIHLQL